MLWGNNHPGTAGRITSSKLLTVWRVYVPIFKQSVASKTFMIRYLSEAPISTIWLLPWRPWRVRTESVLQKGWCNGIGQDKILQVTWQSFRIGFLTADLPTSSELAHVWRWLWVLNFQPLGAQCSYDLRKSFMVTFVCCKLRALPRQFCVFYFPWGKQVFLSWNCAASNIVSAKRENMPSGAMANMCVVQFILQ